MRDIFAKFRAMISHTIAGRLTPMHVLQPRLSRPLEILVKVLLCYSYVSAMVPVKTMKEYDILQEVIVLFSDSVQR